MTTMAISEQSLYLLLLELWENVTTQGISSLNFRKSARAWTCIWQTVILGCW